MNLFNEALENLVRQLESSEDGLKFLTNVCNMISSQIMPVVIDRPEELMRLLSYTDAEFFDELWKLTAREIP